MTIHEVKQAVFATIQSSTETELPISENTHLIREIGLSSIEAMLLLSDLEDRFGINIPANRLRDIQTVNDLCQAVIDCLMKS